MGDSFYTWDVILNFDSNHTRHSLYHCHEYNQASELMRWGFLSRYLKWDGNGSIILNFQGLCYSNASLWVPTREAYVPFFSNNSEWVPNSDILPSEHRAIWLAFWTVLSLWAITKVVLPFIRRFNASCTRPSLTVSNALVACQGKLWEHMILSIHPIKI